MKGKERHDIKTDKFQEFLIVAEEFVIDHAKTIMYSIVGLIIALALYFGITGFMASQQEAASFALHKHMPQINKILSVDASSDLSQEKINELKTSIQTVIDEHSGSSAAKQAKLYLGIIEFKGGNLEAAETTLADFAADGSNDMSQLAQIALSGIQVQKGNYQEAAEMFKRLTEKHNGNSSRLFAYRSAVLFEKAGDSEAAAQMFALTQSKEENDRLFSPAQTQIIETGLAN